MFCLLFILSFYCIMIDTGPAYAYGCGFTTSLRRTPDHPLSYHSHTSISRRAGPLHASAPPGRRDAAPVHSPPLALPLLSGWHFGSLLNAKLRMPITVLG